MIKVVKINRKDKPEEIPGAFTSELSLFVKGDRHDIDMLLKNFFETLHKLEGGS